MKKSTDVLNLYSGEMSYRAYMRAANVIDGLNDELGFVKEILIKVITPTLTDFPLASKFENSNVLIVYKERHSDKDRIFIGVYSDFDCYMVNVVGCLLLEDLGK